MPSGQIYNLSGYFDESQGRAPPEATLQEVLSSRITLYNTYMLAKYRFLLLFGLVTCIFFPVRKVFLGEFSVLDGIFYDFTTFSLYLGDIFILLMAFDLILEQGLKPYKNSLFLLLGATLAITLLSNLTHINYVSLIYLTRLVEVAVVILWIKYNFSFIYEGKVIYFLILLTAIISVIAVFQFHVQHSLGIKLFGEPVFSNALFGIAKINTPTGTIVRPYGLSPHPNILGYILVTASATVTTFCFSIQAYKKHRRALLLALLGCLFFTTLITFSRGAIFVFTVIYATIALIYFTQYTDKNLFLKRLSVTTGCLVMVFSIFSFSFKNLVFSRASFDDNSAGIRQVLLETTMNSYLKNPISGVGLGQSMFNMKHELGYRLEDWEIQPVHNTYILISSELGLFITVFMILGLFTWLIRSCKNDSMRHIGLISLMGRIRQVLVNGSPWSYMVIIALIYGMFDHFLYTSWQAMMLFAFVLGMFHAKQFRQNENPHS